MFFALSGDNFNGNGFAEDALKNGCSFAVIDDSSYKKNSNYIFVDNALQTLQQLAVYHRNEFNIPVIGITGSNGKTTTKELIKCVLQKKYTTSATSGNLNNHIGVPLTLLDIHENTEMAVIEMGANHPGEIEFLCNLAIPDYGIITNIGKAHLEGFGGYHGVIKAKGELYVFLKNNNKKAFVNTDNDLLMGLSAAIERIFYGTTESAEYIGNILSGTPLLELAWSKKGAPEKNTIRTHLPGTHHFENVMAAIAVGGYFNVPENKVCEALREYIPSNNRSQIVKTEKNSILLDAYNANPTNMEAAIAGLAAFKEPDKTAILGDMLELGDYSYDEHKAIAMLTERQKFDRVILIGKNFGMVKNELDCTHYNNVDEAVAGIKKEDIRNSFILIKGSRAIRLEKLIEVL